MVIKYAAFPLLKELYIAGDPDFPILFVDETDIDVAFVRLMGLSK